MPAVVQYGLEAGKVELREVPVPAIDEDEVLLRVGAVGVCGSDIHQYLGTPSWRVNVPVILGHEFTGAVAAVGSRVVGFMEETGWSRRRPRASVGVRLLPLRHL
jgi:threonine dehydrogenase-like Zn-dependent dehydrogenase